MPYILIAQWIERLATDQKVGGSKPSEDAHMFVKLQRPAEQS